MNCMSSAAKIRSINHLLNSKKDFSFPNQYGVANSPNSVLTTILYFREEYEAHIRGKKCPAGVCKALFHYEVDEEKCNGCHLCALKCPQEAITGEKKEPHYIDQDKCIKCSICYEACKFDAVLIK